MSLRKLKKKIYNLSILVNIFSVGGNFGCFLYLFKNISNFKNIFLTFQEIEKENPVAFQFFNRRVLQLKSFINSLIPMSKKISIQVSLFPCLFIVVHDYKWRNIKGGFVFVF